MAVYESVGLPKTSAIGPIPDYPAVLHDDHVFTSPADDGQVVRDHHQGQSEINSNLHEEVEDLGLDGDIESAGWARPRRGSLARPKSPSYPDPLQLSA